jgi:hypothetical protein
MNHSSKLTEQHVRHTLLQLTSLIHPSFEQIGEHTMKKFITLFAATLLIVGMVGISTSRESMKPASPPMQTQTGAVYHNTVTITNNSSHSASQPWTVSVGNINGADVGYGYAVVVNPRAALGSIAITYARIVSAGTVEIGFGTLNGSPVLGTKTFDITIIQ